MPALRIGLVCVFLLAIFFTFSKPARASVLDWIKHVAGFIVQETDALTGMEDAVTIPPTTSETLEQALQDAPFKFAIPAYVPAGFQLQNNVDIYSDSIFLFWTNEEGDDILLQVETEHGQQYLTGTNAAQEIEINGQPAMLFQGTYDSNNTWDRDRKQINIVQRRGDLVYWLIYNKISEGEMDAAGITKELSQMMGSIP
jgi:hypothetical protein